MDTTYGFPYDRFIVRKKRPLRFSVLEHPARLFFFNAKSRASSLSQWSRGIHLPFRSGRHTSHARHVRVRGPSGAHAWAAHEPQADQRVELRGLERHHRRPAMLRAWFERGRQANSSCGCPSSVQSNVQRARASSSRHIVGAPSTSLEALKLYRSLT